MNYSQIFGLGRNCKGTQLSRTSSTCTLRRPRRQIINQTTDYTDWLPIGDYVFEDPDQLIGLCQSECFLPESLWLVADNDDARMVVFSFDVLAQLVEGPIDVLLLTSQKHPAGTSVEPAAIFLEPRRRIVFRIDCDRNEKHILPKAIAECLLHPFEIAVHWRADVCTRREEGVDNHYLVFQHITVEAQLLAVLIDQLDV